MYEKKPKTCVEAGELANEYEQVRKQELVLELQQKPTPGPRAEEVHLEDSQERATLLKRGHLV